MRLRFGGTTLLCVNLRLSILSVLTGPKTFIDLPLDIRATAFQLKVWSALRQIPVGETRSYSHVAAAIGDKSATRAVARACAANPVAVVIPCHRVVRENGDLAGYRWGVKRKEQLLSKERKEQSNASGR